MKSLVALITLTTLFLAIHFDIMAQYDYDKSWKEVTQFEQKRLPASALKVVNDIYQQAKAENNTQQFIKAVVHQLKYVNYKEEDGFYKGILRMREEVNNVKFPAKPILHSMLGEMFWNYYRRHRYKIMNRTETVDYDQDDIATWTVGQLLRESTMHYESSLQNAGESQKEQITDYRKLLDGGNDLGFRYRSTLYDFLAHRALDLYRTGTSGLTKPAEQFELDSEHYLGDSKSFAAMNIQTVDTNAMEYRATLLYQELVRFHLNDDDPVALTVLELNRLNFIESQLTIYNKYELYIKALEDLAKRVEKLEVSGLVHMALAEAFIQNAYLYNPLESDAHQWDYQKALSYCNQTITSFPDSEPAKACYNLKLTIQRQTLNIQTEVQNVPGSPFRGLVQYRNLSTAYYRIIKTSRKEVRDLHDKLNSDGFGSRDQKHIIEFFAQKSPTQSGTYQLPNEGDYHEHSAEVKFDALPVGEYAVLVSATEDFSVNTTGVAYDYIIVTDISHINRNDVKNGSTEVFVLSRTTGKPLKNVKVEAYVLTGNGNGGQSPKLADTFTTDASGYVKIPALSTKRQTNFYLHFLHGDDFNSTQDIKDSYYGGNIRQYVAGRRNVKRRIKTTFFLDRAIYRPGQTVYYKGLVTLSEDDVHPEIVPDHKTVVQLLDVNYQSKESQVVNTNEYGTFSGSFTIPNDGLTGRMQLKAGNGDGNAYFQVEEYKRPKFYVDFDTVEKEFQLNDSVQATGFATAYSGAVVDGAAVTYTVYRTARFPSWWYYRSAQYPSSPRQKIVDGKTTTDNKGRFQIDFKAIPDKGVNRESNPIFDYEVSVDVTDINGETQSKVTHIKVGYTALQIQVPIPTIDRDTISEDLQFPIQTTNLAGSFVPAKGTIKIYQLKTPKRAFRKRYWDQPDQHLYSRETYYRYFP
ncbi:MAG: MG2 domain-containing protein, partial [Bacteroidota bacterium]